MTGGITLFRLSQSLISSHRSCSSQLSYCKASASRTAKSLGGRSGHWLTVVLASAPTNVSKLMINAPLFLFQTFILSRSLSSSRHRCEIDHTFFATLIIGEHLRKWLQIDPLRRQNSGPFVKNCSICILSIYVWHPLLLSFRHESGSAGTTINGQPFVADRPAVGPAATFLPQEPWQATNGSPACFAWHNLSLPQLDTSIFDCLRGHGSASSA